MEESDTGLYVLASEALADNERLRGLVRLAFREGHYSGYQAIFTPEEEASEWEHSDARKSLAPPTATPNP